MTSLAPAGTALIVDDDPQVRSLLAEYAREVLRAAVERLYTIVEHALLLTSVRVSGEESSLAPHPLAPIVAAARARASVPAGRRAVTEEVRGRFFDVLAVREPLTPGGDLGLAPPVAAEILRLLGGGVSVESHAQGVCFVVTLPAADATAAEVR